MKKDEMKTQLNSYETYLTKMKTEDQFIVYNPIDLKDSFFSRLHENSRGKFITSLYKIGSTAFMYHYSKDSFVMNKFQAYFSVNTFICPRRLITNLFEYTCCYIDLDIYRMGLSKYEALYKLESECFGYTLPIPSYVIDSGYGLYIIWQFTDTVPARNSNGFNLKVYRLWNALQKSLLKELTDFGADTACLDAARVLRNTGTFNTKNGTLAEVKLLRNYERKYDMSLLKDELLPPYTPQKGKSSLRRINDNLTLTLLKSKMNSVKFYSGKSSNYNLRKTNLNRYGDLNKLLELREGNFLHKRQTLLFIYRCHLNRLFDKEIALDRTLILNSKLKNPLPINEVISSTKSSERNDIIFNTYKKSNDQFFAGYNYTTEKIIELLEITIEEQHHMTTLCNSDIKWQKFNKNKRDKRRNQNGNTKREQNKINNIYFVHFLKIQGLKNKEISKVSNLSKNTVSVYLNMKQPDIFQVSNDFIESNQYLRVLNYNELTVFQNNKSA